MDVSDLRKRILRALDEARVDATRRRSEVDTAREAYDALLERVVVPVLRQAQAVLKAERQMFTVHAPAGSAKLASDTSTQTFVEFLLDTAGDEPHVLGRVSRARGRERVLVEEKPVAAGKLVTELTEEDVAAFLVSELPKLVRA